MSITGIGLILLGIGAVIWGIGKLLEIKNNSKGV